MMLRYRSAICIFEKYMQHNLPMMLSSINYPCNTFQQVRSIKKHWNPQFRKERKEKFIKVKFPNMDDDKDELSNDQIRSKLKMLGVLPQRDWKERPLLITCTPNIFESYVVPEGDGKFSNITKEGAKQKFQFLEKKSKSFMAIRKIKSYHNDFETKNFGLEVLDIYKAAHEALVKKDKDLLLQYVTETVFPQITDAIWDKTIHWKFLESLEPARIVHARTTNLITKENIFAQITVRFHTQQILCIYDRFGRQIQGSETLKKDVLDYIVFEKHLSNVYGTWRVHGKIIPGWMPPEEISARTYIVQKEEKEEEKSLSTKLDSESVAQTVPTEVLNEQNTKETSSTIR